jgi:predicted dienelactone hydrolase
MMVARALTVLLALTSACVTVPPQPVGPYLVGTRLVSVPADDAAPELPLRIWYPAVSSTQPLAQAVGPLQAEALSRFMGLPAFLTRADARAQRGPPLLVHDKPWPVVVFEHGAGSFDGQSTTLLEDIASSGAIVIAVSHPHASIVAEFPDGRAVWADDVAFRAQQQKLADQIEPLGAELATTVTSAQTATTSAAGFAALRHMAGLPLYAVLHDELEQRLTELERVRRWLAAGAAGSGFAGHIEPERPGLLGHSLGGIVAVEAARRSPAAYAFVVDFDGPALVLDDEDPALHTPMLFLESTEARLAPRAHGRREPRVGRRRAVAVARTRAAGCGAPQLHRPHVRGCAQADGHGGQHRRRACRSSVHRGHVGIHGGRARRRCCRRRRVARTLC